MEIDMSNAKTWVHLAAALVLLWLASPLEAQNPKAREDAEQRHAEEQKWPTKVFQLKYADAGRVQNVMIGVFRGEFRADSQLKTLVVRAPQEIMPAIEEAIKKFDVPPAVAKNIELTAYLLVAELEDSKIKLPSELQPVVTQLRNVFPNYQGYRVLETLVLRTREGSPAEVNGMAPSGIEGMPPSIYNLRFGSARITSDEKGRVVWLSGMKLGARVPIPTRAFQPGVGGAGINNMQFNYQDTGIMADVDIHEGQKVVVGKANLQGPDKALFLVLAAKVTD